MLIEEKEIILQAIGIIKEFSGVRVLDNVCFDVRKGEVHSLIGENGAGKSTLIKIISGVYPKDGGEIYVKGKPVEIYSRQDSLKCGIAVVYQELSVIPSLTVAQNIMVGREETRFGFLKKKKMEKDVQALIDSFGLSLDATRLVSELSIGERQVVEIVKALAIGSSIIIMDEPTAALSQKESESLYNIIRSLRDQGISIIYISHRLDEVYMLSDRITVMRDGKVAGKFQSDEIKPADVVRCMVGKDLNTKRTESLKDFSDNNIVLEVKNLTREGAFYDINLSVHAGEILGIGGLVGAGRTELLNSIFGVDKYTSGEIIFDGKKMPHSVFKNIKSGIGYITEDRRGEGFAPAMSVQNNLEATAYNSVSWLNAIMISSKEKALSKKIINTVNIKPNDPKRKVINLSGGNQQKVVVGKWLTRKSKLLLIDEPTIGVDVGAKTEIYAIIEDLARSGMAVIVVTSDNEELARISNKIIIMRQGRIVHTFNSGLPDREAIALASSGNA